MGFADDVLKKVFGARPNKSLVLEEGVIRRDTPFQKAYEAWKVSSAEAVMEEFRRNLSLSNKGLHDDLRTIWLKMQNAEGFRVFLDELCTPEEDQYVLEYLKEKLVGFPYRMSNSYFKYEEVNGELVREEWYYLKPPIHITEEGEAMNQGFGNIKIELDQSRSRQLKFLATTYSGRMYNDAIPFRECLRHLFGSFSS